MEMAKEAKAKAETEIKEEKGGKVEGEAKEIDSLKEELKKKEEQIKEYIVRLKHLQADFENYKKRVLKEREELYRMIEDNLLLEVIPLYDNFERAFRSFNHNNDHDSFIKGMEMIFSQFNDFLKKKGVEPIEATQEKFDPAKHEALITVESDGEPNIVLEEFERGYWRNGRVLRPSKVKVSKSKKEKKEG